MRREPLVIFLALTIIPLAMAQTSSNPTTGVAGVITIGPVHPGPVRQGMPSSAPLANAAFIVTNDAGTVTSFTTDAQGRFQISLAPGHYAISSRGKIGIRACGPFDVDVVAGKMTSVQWECDTGMR